MPPMFEKAARKLVEKIGDKEFKPVKGIANAYPVRQFSLIRRNKRHGNFLGVSEDPLRFSLMDILEESAAVPDTPEKVPYFFSYGTVWKQHAGGSVDAGAEASLSQETMARQGYSIDCNIVYTKSEALTDLQKRKVKDPESSFLKQCRRTATNLYVVTDTVELRESCVLEDRSTGNFSGKLSFAWNPFGKVTGGGGALKEREEKQVVPKGSVMAYKRKQLVFHWKIWEILHVSDGEEETFPVAVPRSIQESETIQDPSLLDFKNLQEEISLQVSRVARLSKDTKRMVFSNILAMLGDREALESLMDTLEQERLEGHLDGPGGTILSELQKDSSYAQNGPAYCILYLLEAMMVLSDIQHCLLAPSMEKKILPQQRDLVRSILEPNFKCPENIPFTLKPELLAPLQGEDLAITYGLLDECGLKMELPSPRSTWDLEAKEPLCALYGALCVLQQLAEA